MDLQGLRALTGYNGPKKGKSFKHRFTWDTYDGYKNMMNDNNELFLGSSDIEDHLTSLVMVNRYKGELDTSMEEVSFLCTPKEWITFMRNSFDNFRIFEIGSDRGFIFQPQGEVLIKYKTQSSSVEVRVFGNKFQIEEILAKITDKFEIVNCYIEWMYNADGSSIDIPLRPVKLPVSEMYPFLNGEKLEDYYDRFMHDDSSILLLIGPPGTGKTSFIRGLLQHTQSSATVTYDSGILDKDHVFARWIESDCALMVLEDADNFLKPRADGNTMMHKFLNVGDGLVTTKGKKLIFSTNLPSVKDIDSALVRPGRCFDILTFDALGKEDVEVLAKKLNVKLDEGKDSYTIAEIFHKQVHAPTMKNTKMGFM